MMGYKGWILAFMLVAPGDLFVEDRLCDLPDIENGRIALYYYSFKNYYFPMKKEETLSFHCLAGYTTENGSQEARITCAMRGWVPAPKCYKKCTVPLLDHGVFSDTKPTYIIWESLQYSCNSGYLTPGGSRNGTVQCIPDGWSAQPRCIEASGIALETCLAPKLLHGHYSTTQKVFKLNAVLQYECDDGYQSAGGNTLEEERCGPEGWLFTPKCTKIGCSALSPVEHGGLHPRKESYEEGDVVQFFCLKDYSLRGSELIQCYYFGWYPKPPVCEARRNKCPPPPQPPNTKILPNLKTYQHGDMLRLECEPHFQIRGTADIQCENGKWTSPPRCMGYLPPRTDHRKLEDVGEKTSSDVSLSWETNGSCGVPPAVENSLILGLLLTSYETGSSVEYRCPRYHLLRGSSTVRCVQGNWTEPPVCLEPCFVDEENIRDFHIKMKWRLDEELIFLHGDVIEFVCEPGHVLPPFVGQQQLLVQCKRGELKYPKCISKDSNENCASPPVIENGVAMESLTTDSAHRSAVEYSCHEHHVLQGSRAVFCLNGQWTTPPVCIEPCTLSWDEMAEKNLELVWSFDNRPYFLHGEFIQFKCKPRYFSPSNSQSDFRVKCWNGHLSYPVCIERNSSELPSSQATVCPSVENLYPSPPAQRIKQCIPPKQLPHGHVIYTSKSAFIEGDDMSFQCDAGYHPEQQEARAKCTKNGWSPMPRCAVTVCEEPPEVDFGEMVSDERAMYWKGDRVQYRCNLGYTLEGPEWITCNGPKWTSLPKCLAPCSITRQQLEAKHLLLPGGRRRSLVIQNNQTLHFLCREGYVLAAPSFTKCIDGLMNLPSCISERGKTCSRPPTVANGDIITLPQEQYTSGSSVEFKCQQYYAMEGHSRSFCDNGSWTKTPVCLEAVCGEPPTVSNADIIRRRKEVYRLGHHVQYRCRAGFEMSGSDSVTCGIKVWSEPPTCKDVTCSPPSEIAHGELTGQLKERYMPNDTMRYQCDDGWRLFGPVVVTCLNKQWTKPPRCIDAAGNCGRPPPIQNGDVLNPVQELYSPGTTLQYKCQNLYVMNGSSEVRCENGQWTETPTCIEPCTVTEEDMALNNIQLKWINDSKLYTQSGDITEFTCKQNYRKDPSSPPFRARCIEGRLEYPRCIPGY
ncbi:coagulation factor XIII B chain-like [Eublepharis macularius]|uniref:Coagulation factor XIII B chain-like n=1 Tax=Eublepharis macularius TaxID=481883 RepID=A0AA97JD35_EUBMA|nr:coagulation factor XIII B chain-like [Eublepharis macularius]